MNICLNCGVEHNKPKFCSRSCAATYNNKKFPKRTRGEKWQTSECANCNVTFDYNIHASGGKYCSNECSGEHKRRLKVEEWKSAERYETGRGEVPGFARKHLLEETGECCSLCGWSGVNVHTGRPCLEIDHIDDDPFNHSYGNLQVLCPNCHAMKTLPPQKSRGGRYSKGTIHPKHAGLS